MRTKFVALCMVIAVTFVFATSHSVRADINGPASTRSGGLLLVSGTVDETINISLFVAGLDDRIGAASLASCSASGNIGFIGAANPGIDYATCDFELHGNGLAICDFALDQVSANGTRKHVIVDLRNIQMQGKCGLLAEGVLVGPESEGSQTNRELLIFITPKIVKLP